MPAVMPPERAEAFLHDHLALGLAQPFQRLAQFHGAFAHGVLQELFLVGELEVLVARAQEVLDAQQHLDVVEGLRQKIGRADGQRAAFGFQADVGGQHEDGHAVRRIEILRKLRASR